jgi:hypothetical protein
MRQKMTLVAIALAFLALVGHRIWRSAAPRGELPVMPQRAGDDEEQQLHRTPGGAYTQADIEANGRTLPSQKYRGFQARHDVNPRPGDRLCPVTRTVASPRCTWKVGDREYQFCCPPCIDEFVRLAREFPDQILPPEAYVK